MNLWRRRDTNDYQRQEVGIPRACHSFAERLPGWGWFWLLKLRTREKEGSKDALLTTEHSLGKGVQRKKSWNVVRFLSFYLHSTIAMVACDAAKDRQSIDRREWERTLGRIVPILPPSARRTNCYFNSLAWILTKKGFLGLFSYTRPRFCVRECREDNFGEWCGTSGFEMVKMCAPFLNTKSPRFLPTTPFQETRLRKIERFTRPYRVEHDWLDSFLGSPPQVASSGRARKWKKEGNFRSFVSFLKKTPGAKNYPTLCEFCLRVCTGWVCVFAAFKVWKCVLLEGTL